MKVKQLEFNGIEPSEAIEIPFEEAVSRLEVVVKALEGGNLSLEESLNQFQAGIQLVRLCNARLDEAEGKIQWLLENPDGSITVQDGGDV